MIKSSSITETFIPIFARIIGLSKDGKYVVDVSDPQTEPVWLISFLFRDHTTIGYHIPRTDRFYIWCSKHDVSSDNIIPIPQLLNYQSVVEIGRTNRLFEYAKKTIDYFSSHPINV